MSRKKNIYEEIEEEEKNIDDQITIPFNPANTRIDSDRLSLDGIIFRLKENEINLQPEFQRSPELWNEKQKSQLIESLLLRIPLPAFYFDGSNDDKWLVVDGLQRLTTLYEFVIEKDETKKFKLSQLEYLKQFEGKFYEELPRWMQRRIRETQIQAHIIRPGTPLEVKYNIFKRINTGGVVLRSQEIRHALNPGYAVAFLKELAATDAFLEATKRKISPKRMMDREFILRFVAFSLEPPSKYKIGHMDGFLTEMMARLNKLSFQKREDLKLNFIMAMKLSITLFGEEAFRKQQKNGSRKLPINKALFEAWSVVLSQLSTSEQKRLIERKNILKEKNIELMSNSEFWNSITQSTGSIKRVRLRFSYIKKLVEDVLQLK